MVISSFSTYRSMVFRLANRDPRFLLILHPRKRKEEQKEEKEIDAHSSSELTERDFPYFFPFLSPALHDEATTVLRSEGGKNRRGGKRGKSENAQEHNEGKWDMREREETEKRGGERETSSSSSYNGPMGRRLLLSSFTLSLPLFTFLGVGAAPAEEEEPKRPSKLVSWRGKVPR